MNRKGTYRPVQFLGSITQNGDYGKAWRVLADNGDGYADNAAAVTGDVRDGSDYAMQTMVRNH